MSHQFKMFNKYVFCQLKTKSEGIWNNIGWIKINLPWPKKIAWNTNDIQNLKFKIKKIKQVTLKN